MNMALSLLEIRVANVYKDLGVQILVEEQKDRLFLQHLMYLFQRGGWDLGFRFRWYDHGPFCPRLSEVYYAIARVSADDLPQVVIDPIKADRYQHSLTQVQTILYRCQTLADIGPVPLTCGECICAVATLDYIRTVRRESVEQSLETFTKERPRLAPLLQFAHDALEGFHKFTPDIDSEKKAYPL